MFKYHIEVTDTFNGEANYCWKRDHYIKARSLRGAAQKLAYLEGPGWKQVFSAGDYARYDLKDAAVCAFIEELEAYMERLGRD